MDNVLKYRLPTADAARSTALNLITIVLGAFLVAASLNVLLIPYGLLTGGVAGLALVILYTFKIPVFITIFLLNIPIFWLGAREISWQFLWYSLAGALLLVLLLPATEGLIPPPQVDLILAAIFGGAVHGIGLGMVFRGRGSTGGTDIIAVILRKKKNMGIGEVGFYSNLLVIGISLALFPLNIALYSILAIYMAGKMTDMVITGINTQKSVIIISNKPFEIGNRIINEMHRGVTYLAGIGAFTREEKTVVNCVTNRFEIAKLKGIVSETDPGAFVYIYDASEVLGKGFARKV